MGRRASTPSKNNLRAWREHARLTQEQLAEKVGTTSAVISLLESGARGLSDKWLRLLAPALGTKPGHLLDYLPDDFEGKLVQVAADMPAEKREQALAILETFRKAS